MDAPQIDVEMLRAVIKVRNELLFELADQGAPPDEYAAPLWQAYKLLAGGIETMKQAIGFEEPEADTGWTIYKPDGS
jgi:hypothetical protein